ncbi:MAG: hypothetical protein K6T74_07225 [Geminicoccaceae bacterium]|nr:hypothetical protein [Geminicoccaceae bacterium]
MRSLGTSCATLPRTTGRPSLAGRLLAILELVETWLTRRRQRQPAGRLAGATD